MTTKNEIDKDINIKIDINTFRINDKEYIMVEDINKLLDLLEYLIEENNNLKNNNSNKINNNPPPKEDKDYKRLYEHLVKENEEIINIIVNAYNNERTMLGKSVLKQLMESLGWDIKWN